MPVAFLALHLETLNPVTPKVGNAADVERTTCGTLYSTCLGKQISPTQSARVGGLATKLSGIMGIRASPLFDKTTWVYTHFSL